MIRIGRIRQGGSTEVVVSLVDHPTSSWYAASSFLPEVTDFRAALEARRDLGAALRGAHSAESLPVEDRDFLCPVDRAGKIFAVGLNYLDHAEEVGVPVPEVPFVFVKASNSLNDPFGTIEVTGDVAAQPDYEAELAIVIGSTCKNVTPDEALAHVGGYAVANDFSAREWQDGSPWVNWLRAKGQDGYCPIGPWVTSSEAVNPGRLRVSARVNGELRQDSNTDQLVFSVAETVSFISRGVTLEPGDVLLTGTPSGSAFAMEGQPWLEDGDRVECSIAELGTIDNIVRVS